MIISIRFFQTIASKIRKSNVPLCLIRSIRTKPRITGIPTPVVETRLQFGRMSVGSYSSHLSQILHIDVNHGAKEDYVQIAAFQVDLWAHSSRCQV